MPATARRSEPNSSSESCNTHLDRHYRVQDPSFTPSEHPLTNHSSELDPDPPASPFRAQQQTSRTSTPRPSISPLSTASKPPNLSPEATRDATIHEPEDAEEESVNNAINTEIAENGDQLDDSSSVLSDPLDDNDEERQHAGPVKTESDGAPLTAQRSVDADSEAETERLDQTPQKLRLHADSIEKTPSKLSHAAIIDDDELSDPPSPTQIGAGAASSTSTIATAGRKRKHSDTADSPLTSEDEGLGESPRKRSHHELPRPEQDKLATTIDEEEAIEQQLVEREAPMATTARDIPRAPTAKGVKVKKGKQKGKKPLKELAAQANDDAVQDTVEAESEPNKEKIVQTEEEKKHNGEASVGFEGLAKQFAAFREKLYNERLRAMDLELKLLSQTQCQHPEYMRQVQCVDARLEKQTREAHAYYHYRQRALRERTLGDRLQLHSQYFQHVRDLREDALYSLGEDWYKIQKERRESHQENDEKYMYKFVDKRSHQLRVQAKYNQEVSVLSGVAKYVGFPAAPEIAGAAGDALEDDVKKMKVSIMHYVTGGKVRR